jgi:hypothetical protein
MQLGSLEQRILVAHDLGQGQDDAARGSIRPSGRRHRTAETGARRQSGRSAAPSRHRAAGLPTERVLRQRAHHRHGRAVLPELRRNGVGNALRLRPYVPAAEQARSPKTPPPVTRPDTPTNPLRSPREVAQ